MEALAWTVYCIGAIVTFVIAARWLNDGVNTEVILDSLLSLIFALCWPIVLAVLIFVGVTVGAYRLATK